MTLWNKDLYIWWKNLDHLSIWGEFSLRYKKSQSSFILLTLVCPFSILARDEDRHIYCTCIIMMDKEDKMNNLKNHTSSIKEREIRSRKKKSSKKWWRKKEFLFHLLWQLLFFQHQKWGETKIEVDKMESKKQELEASPPQTTTTKKKKHTANDSEEMPQQSSRINPF